MLNRAIVRIGFAAVALGVTAGSAAAQQQDVQVTSEAISRTCSEIHGTPQAQVEPPTVRGANDITLNCRLVGPGGPTIAQVSPAEVCQRVNGSTEWYRGMGTQVFCRAAADGTPAPRSFTINQADIAKACQRTHRNPQATAEPATMGRYGLELNCRLVNQNGVTLARVSPEDVCEAKFGTREWMGVLGSTTFVCKGTPIDTARSDGLPNKGGGGGGGGGGGSAGQAFNDVPLTPEAITKGCRVLHGADATGAPSPLGREPTINCNTARGPVSHKAAEFCPKVSGTGEWYLTDFGRGSWLAGEAVGAAPRVHVCRGPGPLQYHALADIGRYCNGKGYRFGNYGTLANKPPFCSNGAGSLVPVTIADVCRDVHRAGAHEFRGVVYLCTPAGAPAPVVATTSVILGTDECPHCGPMANSIVRHEQQIKTQEGRIAAEEEYKRKQEAGARTRTGAAREEFREAARTSATLLEGMNALLAEMKTVLAQRKAEFAELQARHAQSGHTRPPSSEPAVKPVEQPASPPKPTFRTVERPRSPPEPTFETVERPPSPPEPTFQTTERTGPPQTPPAAPPLMTPPAASSSPDKTCVDHRDAELTNGERVFHRLYVLGRPNSPEEHGKWMRQLGRLKEELEAPGRQAPGSTTEFLDKRPLTEFVDAIRELQRNAQPCEEVTIYINAHGGLMPERGKENVDFKRTGETRGEFIRLNEETYLQDVVLGTLLQGFHPTVSVSVIMDSCFGGGFAGQGNIEETRLVQVIGLYTVCYVLVDAINQGIGGATKGPHNRALTAEVKDHMLSKGWPLGEPSDNLDDLLFIHQDEHLAKILPGYRKILEKRRGSASE